MRSLPGHKAPEKRIKISGSIHLFGVSAAGSDMMVYLWGECHVVPKAQTFANLWGKNTAYIKKLTDVQMKTCKTGFALNENAHLAYAPDAAYVISGKTAMQIDDSKAFGNCRFSNDNAKQVTKDDIDALVPGDIITA